MPIYKNGRAFWISLRRVIRCVTSVWHACTCVCTYGYMYIYVYIYIHIYTCIFECMYIGKVATIKYRSKRGEYIVVCSKYIHMYVGTCIHISLDFVCIFMRIFICIYTLSDFEHRFYVCIFMYVRIHMRIYACVHSMSE
jgi:hypothetical protein